MADANHAAAEIQVVAPAEIRVKTRAQFQNGRDAPLALNPAPCGLQSARQQLEQRTFARAVVADHAYALTAPQLE